MRTWLIEGCWGELFLLPSGVWNPIEEATGDTPCGIVRAMLVRMWRISVNSVLSLPSACEPSLPRWRSSTQASRATRISSTLSPFEPKWCRTIFFQSGEFSANTSLIQFAWSAAALAARASCSTRCISEARCWAGDVLGSGLAFWSAEDVDRKALDEVCTVNRVTGRCCSARLTATGADSFLRFSISAFSEAISSSWPAP